MHILYSFLATLAAYLVGSLSFAVIVSRLMGLKDPRTFGSKNPGATNVLRSGSKAAAAVTLLLDALKGFVPVLAVRLLGKPLGLEDGTVALVGLPPSSGTSGLCSSASRAARASPPSWAWCSASIRCSAWPRRPPG